MMDPRVRQAFIKAIDRPTLAKTVIPGGEVAETMNGICFPSNVGCSLGSSPYAYDPAGAKRLLAEAGLPDGFDMELTTYTPIREIGEAVAGQLRAVGIRASIQPVPLNVWARVRAEGKMTAAIGIYPTSGQPDVGNMMDFFFTGDRDYWRDPAIIEIKDKGAVELDEQKRRAIYKPALDRVNEQAYILPLPELPIVWVHTKDVQHHGQSVEPAGNSSWRLGLEIRREGEAMLYSTDRIMTTHAGSLPRPQDLREMVFAKARGEAVDSAALERRLTERRRRHREEAGRVRARQRE